jgi:hypothetical protein
MGGRWENPNAEVSKELVGEVGEKNCIREVVQSVPVHRSNSKAGGTSLEAVLNFRLAAPSRFSKGQWVWFFSSMS